LNKVKIFSTIILQSKEQYW